MVNCVTEISWVISFSDLTSTITLQDFVQCYLNHLYTEELLLSLFED